MGKWKICFLYLLLAFPAWLLYVKSNVGALNELGKTVDNVSIAGLFSIAAESYLLGFILVAQFFLWCFTLGVPPKACFYPCDFLISGFDNGMEKAAKGIGYSFILICITVAVMDFHSGNLYEITSAFLFIAATVLFLFWIGTFSRYRVQISLGCWLFLLFLPVLLIPVMGNAVGFLWGKC